MIASRSQAMPKEEIEALQLKRLKETIQRVYSLVPHYRKSFDKAGVGVESINTLKDLAKFPFTLKQDLRDNYPFGLLLLIWIKL